jgi:haloacid dehalogenase superfamily, subfamily IA, variant 3 with third motif having DD or ED
VSSAQQRPARANRPQIRALLFDADGVLQWPRPGAWEAFAALGGGDVGFVTELLAEESKSMTGQVELSEVLQALIRRRRLGITVEELIEVWCRIEVNSAMLEVVAQARRAGLRTALATNQQPHRGAWMQQNLPYSEQFDQLCYSFELGLAKPDRHFFTEVVRRLDVAPEEAVMIDDLERNVRSARRAGLHGVVCTRRDDAASIRRKLHRLGVPGF